MLKVSIRQVLDNKHTHQGGARETSFSGSLINPFQRLIIEPDDHRLLAWWLGFFSLRGGGLPMFSSLDKRHRVGRSDLRKVSLRLLCDCHASSFRYLFDVGTGFGLPLWHGEDSGFDVVKHGRNHG